MNINKIPNKDADAGYQQNWFSPLMPQIPGGHALTPSMYISFMTVTEMYDPMLSCKLLYNSINTIMVRELTKKEVYVVICTQAYYACNGSFDFVFNQLIMSCMFGFPYLNSVSSHTGTYLNCVFSDFAETTKSCVAYKVCGGEKKIIKISFY